MIRTNLALIGPKPAGETMVDDAFQNAYARVRGRHSDQAWFNLTQREITSAIYAEMRSIDRAKFADAETRRISSIAVAAE